ncbi:MAG TPA: ABC-2 family transporter protein [Roseiflexaceae bacterium]|nr:ABC-2 family transporter protein [Roseiflexaceae bacterium]
MNVPTYTSNHECKMIALYFRLIGARIRSQMQYKVSFWLDTVGFMLATGLEFAVIAILYTRFPSIGGWSAPEVALLYGMTSIAFSMAEMVARGFDAPFERMMQQGSFDRVLTRPLGSFFQIMASEFQLRRLGRTAQGALVLSYALSRLEVAWTPSKGLLLLLAVLSGAVIYTGLIVIGATICFWTIKTPEVINVFTFGGQTLVSYPLSIYNRLIRTVFLSIVPVAFANYPAALVILSRSDPHGLPGELAWAAPLAAALFFGAARAFWQYGVSKYQSTGS